MPGEVYRKQRFSEDRWIPQVLQEDGSWLALGPPMEYALADDAINQAIISNRTTFVLGPKK